MKIMYKQEIRLCLESKLINLELLSNATRGICETILKDEVLVYQLVLCLVEAVTNVIMHAYHRQPNHWVDIHIILDQQCVTFKVLDNGDKASLPEGKREWNFDPDDITSVPESGRGLFLIHSLMDEVSYGQDSEGKNVFTMVKKVGE
jgi:serine/threonine-protein kinase RsbW